MSELRGRHLHVDCASGAAGDMMLGALIDLGVPVDVIGDALDAIGAGRERLRVAKVMKHGIAATDLKVDTDRPFGDDHAHAHENVHGDDHAHDHAHVDDNADVHDNAHVHGADHDHVHGRDHGPAHVHDHAHSHAEHAHAEHAHSHDHRGPHAHHHYGDIRRRIVDAKLTDGTRRRALDIFDRLARAEAKLHGTTVETVSFHEVGAIDSIVDVVGTAAALDWLAPASVSCVSVAMGHGTITCAHGVLPVPAPAALEVMREAGGVMADGGVARELCTPTGAAILAATVTTWTAAPVGRARAVGWGAGDSELADRANVVRVVVIEPASGATDTVWEIEANLDDMSPELCGAASDALFAAGALDVWWTPITMKKGRPAFTLSVLADGAKRDEVIATMLRETTTIGVRYAPRTRTILERSIVEVTTRYGKLPIKVASDGGVVRNAAPEYEACAAAARRHAVPVKLVFAAALAAFDSSR